MAWDRPHHTPSGHEALLHYVVPGVAGPDLRISRSRHRVEAIPAELRIVTCTPVNAGLPSFDAEPVFAAALDEALGARASEVRAVDVATVVRGVFKDPPTLDYLRDALGVIAALLDKGGLAVLDPQTFRWWSPERFREDVHSRDDVEAFQHVTVLRSREPAGIWVHTRGLRKFARPDLSVRGVQPSWYDAAVEMLERFTWGQVRGLVVPDGQPVRMAGVPDGLVCRLEGAPDDPDFNNVHLRIALP